MAVFPMERDTYTWLDDNSTRLLNTTFQPSSLPPEGTAFTWLDAFISPEYFHNYALHNMSLAMFALVALQDVYTSNPKRLLSPLTRMAGRIKVDVSRTVINIFKTLVGLVLLLSMVPMMLPVMAFFWVTSILVRVCYALLWGSSVKKVEGLDCVWGVEEEGNNPFINVCLRVRGAPSLHSVQQAILTKVMKARDSDGNYKYRKFRQLFLQRCGYCCWRDDPHFDINNHVREIELSSFYTAATSEDVQGPEEAVAGENIQQAKNEDTDELLQRFVSEELTKTMPENTPPWEVLLVARDDGR